MIEEGLGPLPIDIHGGGLDLIFPHHENEIAQSVCADHAPALANYWVHNGFLDMAGEKMSKSLGNILLVHDLIEKVPGEVIRWALLSAHYRQPLDWTGELVEQCRSNVDSLYGAIQRADVALRGATPTELGLGNLESVLVKERIDGFVENALCDDLNTPKAYAMIADGIRQLNLAVDARNLGDIAFHRAVVWEWCRLLGFLQADPESWFQGAVTDDARTRIEQLIAARTEARKAKDWPAADRIRAELTAMGVEVMDSAGGATWRFQQTEKSQ